MSGWSSGAKRGCAVWPALLLALVSVACSGDDVGPADGGRCQPERQLDPCNRCEDEQCCAEVMTCEANPACKTLADCLVDCPAESAGDRRCSDACYAESPEGVADLGARFACNAMSCTASCPGEVPPCVSCYVDLCAAEYTRCSGSADCFLLVRCDEGCQTDECTQACKEARPGGAADFDAFVACTFDRCAKPCG